MSAISAACPLRIPHYIAATPRAQTSCER